MRRCLPRGVSAREGGCLLLGVCLVGCLLLGVCRGGAHLPPLWTEFLTHACENITFPQLRLRAVIKITLRTSSGTNNGCSIPSQYCPIFISYWIFELYICLCIADTQTLWCSYICNYACFTYVIEMDWNKIWSLMLLMSGLGPYTDSLWTDRHNWKHYLRHSIDGWCKEENAVLSDLIRKEKRSKASVVDFLLL